MFDLTNLTTTLHKNLSVDALLDMAKSRKEGVVAANGAFAVTTGTRTGRSPKDRFIVEDAITKNSIHWGKVNQAISAEKFQTLWQRALDHINSQCEAFVGDYRVGADVRYARNVTVITEYAWHNVFAHNLFIPEPLPSTNENQWTILNVPSLATHPEQDGVNSEATLLIDFTQQQILLYGLRYGGEMKKAMFSIMNFLMPEKDVLPMHCAANKGDDGETTLFFGLSGTGKTTLSADPSRHLIGDDEHGWGKEGVFNFEGGCYAKCIKLSRENEPLIYHAIKRGAIMENVALDEKTLAPDYDDSRYSENSRVAYPRSFIENCVPDNQGKTPTSLVFLTCDLFGVLPPVAKLTPAQAAYYFLSGYTAHVGSTEVGSEAGIKPTFSTCFGAPFFPRPATVYADLLMKRIREAGCDVFLVNTGWHSNAFVHGGKRFSIPTTRRIVDSIVNGELKHASFSTLKGFDLAIPDNIEGVDAQLLNPENCWKDHASYEEHLQKLMARFIDNFRQFDVAKEVLVAGPKLESVPVF
jgi:phosphoenolpyruvate carboxykinase (ATP)